jgi:hypothetical protein
VTVTPVPVRSTTFDPPLSIHHFDRLNPVDPPLAHRTGVRYAGGVLPTPITPARDRCLPVDDLFATLLPDAGLRRGHVIGCAGQASMSLALSLASRAMVTGSWLASVGVPTLGLEAAAELGVPLSRLVDVDAGRSPSDWAERVAAVADGFDLVLTRPPAGAERLARKVRHRLQARGVVLFAVGPSTPGLPCDIEFVTTTASWVGIGRGHGHVAGRRATVRVGGRRMPRPIETELWLPGPDGRPAPIEQGADLLQLGRAV